MRSASWNERQALQIAVALAGLVPVGAGFTGLLFGPDFLALPNEPSAHSHFRYLAGLLFGIGIAFWTSVPQIERHALRFNLLAPIVVTGGLARLLGAVALGDAPGLGMMFALVMELLVTPSLWAWQRRLADQSI